MDRYLRWNRVTEEDNKASTGSSSSTEKASNASTDKASTSSADKVRPSSAPSLPIIQARPSSAKHDDKAPETKDDDGGGGDKAAETKHDKALMTTSMEIAGMAANDKKTGAEVRMKCKFIPDPNNAAEVRLRSMLDKHNEREARRKARKRAAADV